MYPGRTVIPYWVGIIEPPEAFPIWKRYSIYCNISSNESYFWVHGNNTGFPGTSPAIHHQYCRWVSYLSAAQRSAAAAAASHPSIETPPQCAAPFPCLSRVLLNSGKMCTGGFRGQGIKIWYQISTACCCLC